MGVNTRNMYSCLQKYNKLNTVTFCSTVIQLNFFLWNWMMSEVWNRKVDTLGELFARLLLLLLLLLLMQFHFHSVEVALKLVELNQIRINIFIISNFRRVLNVLCFLLGNSPAYEFYMPTFRNTLFHLHKHVCMQNIPTSLNSSHSSHLPAYEDGTDGVFRNVYI